jgi:hypothetical protein
MTLVPCASRQGKRRDAAAGSNRGVRVWRVWCFVGGMRTKAQGQCSNGRTSRLALVQLSCSQIALAGLVAAGEPIEPIPQTEWVEVPKSMMGRGDTFALRGKGSSMRDEGFLSGDVVVVQKHSTARKRSDCYRPRERRCHDQDLLPQSWNG